MVKDSSVTDLTRRWASVAVLLLTTSAAFPVKPQRDRFLLNLQIDSPASLLKIAVNGEYNEQKTKLQCAGTKNKIKKQVNTSTTNNNTFHHLCEVK